MTKRKKFQCIGGPICGQELAMNATGWVTVTKKKLKDEYHYYRMCCVQDTRGKVAQYWHYIGREPNERRPPSLFPARRYFKWAGGK